MLHDRNMGPRFRGDDGSTPIPLVMTESMLFVFTALVLGAMHSFAPDHLAAVSVFVSRRPSWREALGLGARWGVGHSLTVVLVGGGLVLSGLRLPEQLETMAERVVGVVLVALGIFAMARAQKLHGHWHEHDGERHWHLHSHRSSDAHEHDHRALIGIGMLHGLAGTGALVVALPVTVAGSRAGALAFLVAFGIGTILSMSLFGAAAGWLLSATGSLARNIQIHRIAIALAGLLSVAVGVWWIAAGGG